MRHVSILNFRYFVFTLALGYWFYQFMVTDYTMVGLQFRLLTFWGLTGAVSVAWLMLSLSRKGLPPAHDALVSAVAVLNGIVVFLYWKYVFYRPGSGKWIRPHRLVSRILSACCWAGPDDSGCAVYKRRVQTAPKGSTSDIFDLSGVYFWTEVITRPLNDTPIGSVVSGLPYPFLNDMTLQSRIGFYATTIATSLLMYLVGWLIGVMFPKLRFQLSA